MIRTLTVRMLLTLFTVGILGAQQLSIAVIRVGFQPDTSPATTGDGSFVLADTFGLDCSDWTLDPPPHNRFYFEDHLRAQNSYWSRVSSGAVGIDLRRSTVYPLDQDGAYLLPHDMLYYHPYLEDFDETAKLFEMSRDAIALADGDIDFSQYTTVVLVHAGMGGDFAFALDPTPGNIPSAYLSQPDFGEYGVIQTDEGVLDDLIIIPESQNFQQFKETRSLFADADDPCFYQVALNGTLALMLGFHLGLPPLYDTESGTSLVGGFALMDQGSNNFHGVVPAYPDPYTRMLKGWVTPILRGIGDSVSIHVDDPPVKVPITEDEYYLIENRQRNMRAPVDMVEWIDDAADDTVSVQLGPSGVVIDVDEQHAGVPGNGLYIWHIDENAWYSDENPNGGPVQLVDFVEADGAQDMGHTTQLIFADFLETGWWFDSWYAGNPGWFDLNRYQDVIGDSLLYLNSSTSPSTRSNSGLPTHLRIENISRNAPTMSFSISSDRIANTDGFGSFIGWGGQTGQLWGFNLDSSAIVEGIFSNGHFTLIQNDLLEPGQILRAEGDSSFQFRYPWVFPNLDQGVNFIDINSGEEHNYPGKDHPQDVILSPDLQLTLSFVAQNPDNTYSLVKYFDDQGQFQSSQLQGLPVARFQTSAGIQPLYDASQPLFAPVGVTPYRDPDDSHGPVPDALDILYWSADEGGLVIKHLPDGETDILDVEEPLAVIPLDADLDGYYEIALCYPRSIRVINQKGVNFTGSPFSVEEYFGNPLAGSLLNGQPGIFLRHSMGYSIFGFDGELLDAGVLPEITERPENYLSAGPGLSLIRSGQEILYFEYSLDLGTVSYWSAPEGNAAGTRVVSIPIVDGVEASPVRTGSVFNYPNPVKAQLTTIRAWLGDVDKWRIEIFSMNGSQVASAELPVLQKHSYNEWVWDSAKVSNGLYLAQVSAGGQAEIIKIAVIR